MPAADEPYTTREIGGMFGDLKAGQDRIEKQIVGLDDKFLRKDVYKADQKLIDQSIAGAHESIAGIRKWTYGLVIALITVAGTAGLTAALHL